MICNQFKICIKSQLLISAGPLHQWRDPSDFHVLWSRHDVRLDRAPQRLLRLHQGLFFGNVFLLTSLSSTHWISYLLLYDPPQLRLYCYMSIGSNAGLFEHTRTGQKQHGALLWHLLGCRFKGDHNNNKKLTGRMKKGKRVEQDYQKKDTFMDCRSFWYS